MKNYYEILGVDKNASLGMIKRAYRQLAFKLHPDRNPVDHIFDWRRVTEAYSVLSYSEKRKNYDKLLEPITSVEDLFERRESGRKVLESMVPAAPKAPQKGRDLVMAVEVKEDILERGGSLLLERLQLQFEITPELGSRRWCRLDSKGEKGINRAPDGDLFIVLINKEESREKK